MAIEFEVRGQRAVLTQISPCQDPYGTNHKLVAHVDFGPGCLEGTNWLTTGVGLPAREYTKEELIKHVIAEIECKFQEHQRERKKRKEIEATEAWLKNLADRVNKVVQGRERR